MPQLKQALRQARYTSNWFRPAKYPTKVIICPLCELPETTGVYANECHCWDAHTKCCGHPPGGHSTDCEVALR